MATDYYADAAGGSWTANTTWHVGSNAGPQPPAGSYPGSAAGDLAVVNQSGGVTVSASVPSSITLQESSGTVSIDSGGTLLIGGVGSTVASGSAFVLNGGTISGGGTLTIGGTFTWRGGSIVSATSVAMPAGSTLAFTSEGNGTLTGSSDIDLRGTMTVAPGAGRLSINDGGRIANEATIQLLGDVTINSDGANNARIINSGTLTKTAGAGTATVAVRVDNSGTVDVTTGTLNLQGGGNQTGSFTVPAGQTLGLYGSGMNLYTFTATDVMALAASSSVSGEGTVAIGGASIDGSFALQGSNGNMVVRGPVVVNDALTTPLLTMAMTYGAQGQRLTVNGSVNVTGGASPMQWDSGSIAGTGPFVIGPAATVLMVSYSPEVTGTISVTGRTITNNGTFLGGNTLLALDGGSTFQNNGFWGTNGAAGAVITRITTHDTGTFVNDGHFQSALTNSGSNNVSSNFINHATLELLGGSVTFGAGIVQTSGTMTMAGTKLTAPNVDIHGGVLSGTGTIGGTLTNGGTVQVGGDGAPGLLTVTTFIQTPAGTLEVELAGTQAGTGYDRLGVLQNATFDGTMNVTLTNGYVPSGGDTYDVVTYAGKAGQFAVEHFPAYGNGQTLGSSYLSSSYRLTALQSGTSDLIATQSNNAPSPMADGDSVTFTINIQNSGSAAASSVVLTDNLSGGTLLSATSSIGTCSGTGPITCNIGTLAGGGNAVVTITVRGTPGTLTNSATVSSSTPDANPANNSTGTTSITVSALADIAIDVTGPYSANAGDPVVYTVTVTNYGPDTATGVTVQPVASSSSLHFVSNTGDCTTVYPCHISDIPAGQTRTITSTYTTTGGSIGIELQVYTTSYDRILSNNDASPKPPGTTADISSSQTTSGGFHGQIATFQVTITNAGPAAAPTVTLVDNITGAPIVSATTTRGSCTVTGNVGCSIGSLAAGESAVVTISVNAQSIATITSDANVQDANTHDPNPANNSSSAAINVTAAADLSVTKSGPVTASPGDAVAYMIVVHNAGPDPAAAVVLSDPTPAGLTFQSNSGACTTPFPCSLGTLAPGDTRTITATYAAVGGGAIVNQATVSSSTFDAVAGNNSASVVTTVACTTPAPTAVSPQGSNVATTGTLDWSGSGATSYDVMFGPAGSGCSAFYGSTRQRSLPYAGLAPATTYEWRVIAYSDSCSTSSSSCVTFTTSAATVCTVPPASALRAVAQATSGTAYRIEWDGIAGATRYAVDEAASDTFAGAATVDAGAQTSFVFRHDVISPTAYYYRVRAFNACTPGGGATSLPARVAVVPADAATANFPSQSVDAGSKDPVTQRVFVAGQTGTTLFFTARSDQPWMTVTPSSGVLPPEGVTLQTRIDPSVLINGTHTATVIVSIGSSAGTNGNGASTAAATTTRVPVSINIVTPVGPLLNETAPPYAMIMPSVGHAAGVNSHWQSDVRITNAGPAEVHYRLTFTPSGGASAGIVYTVVRIPASTTLALDDIVLNWFGRGSLGDGMTGMLEIAPLDDGERSAMTTVASSRTYNVQNRGTLGQFIPAVPFSDFVGAAAAGAPAQVLSLQQIAQNDFFRTNIGLAEAAGSPVTAAIRIYDPHGVLLKEVPVQLGARQQVQFDSILARNGITASDARAEVQVMSGSGRITAYASVIDNRTGDPLLALGVPLAQQAGARRYVLPGVANVNTGFALWQTDMRIFNYGTAPQSATVTMIPANNDGAPLTAQVVANPREVLALDNVVKSLFNRENLGGSIHVDTAQPSLLAVTARTYNVTSNGTLGQFVSAIAPSDGIGASDGVLYIPQVEDSVRYRTNIGLAEMMGEATEVVLQVTLPDGTVIPAGDFTLAPREFRQLSLIRGLGIGDVYNALVTVRVVHGGRVTAYASVIDETTGDPTFVPPQKVH